MARGPVTSLIRFYTSRDNSNKFKLSLLNRCIHSFREWGCSGGPVKIPVRSGFCATNECSLMNCEAPFHYFYSGRSIFSSNVVSDVRKFCSLVGNGDDESEDMKIAESACDYDVDSARSAAFEEVDDEANVSEFAVVENVDDDSGDEVCELNSVDENEGRSISNQEFVSVAFCDPVELYRELRTTEKPVKPIGGNFDALREVFTKFSRSGWATNQALAIYIGRAFFPTAAHKFRLFFLKRCSADISNYVVSLSQVEAEKFLFPIFIEFCLEEFPDEIKRLRGMIEKADLTKPHTWFPFARAMKRKIIYHCGPTNSGKTYNALQRFMEAKKGIYCSPLRLLAMEVFDKVNAVGVYCSLLTGQEKKHVPFSNHIACTVEMVSTEELYDVAVIDEIQMMSDPSRGYAWTRALLGVQADEIHLCGDPSVLNIVRKLCSETGDVLVENHYGRFKPLVVEAKTLLGDLKKCLLW